MDQSIAQDPGDLSQALAAGDSAAVTALKNTGSAPTQSQSAPVSASNNTGGAPTQTQSTSEPVTVPSRVLNHVVGDISAVQKCDRGIDDKMICDMLWTTLQFNLIVCKSSVSDTANKLLMLN